MKKGTIKGSIMLLAVIMVLSLVLAACGNNNAEVKETSSSPAASEGKVEDNGEVKEELPFVNLTWIMRAAEEADTKLIIAEMNKVFKEKINAEVDIKFIDPGSYNDKVRTMIAANENYDVVMIGSGIGDFYGSQSKGAFLPITDLVKKYAPGTYATIPEAFWGAVTVKGDIYAVPNYQIVARNNGFKVQKIMAEKYGFDITKMTKMADLEPFLAAIKENEPASAVPVLNYKLGMFNDALTHYGIEQIGGFDTPGVISIDGTDHKVFNQFESPQFLEHITLMRDWYNKGFIPRDAGTLTEIQPLLKTGNVMSSYSNKAPGDEAASLTLVPVEYLFQPLDTPYVTTGNIAATLQAVNRNSKNPERAMMMIELMNTDVELYNLMTFGIEDKHYKKVGDKKVELIANAGYYPNKAWAFGNQFNAYLLPGQPDDVWEQTIALNSSAKASRILGFIFDQEPVKAEIAQSKSVVDEFAPSLWTGSVDPAKYLPEFIEKLKLAGADIIIAEKQKQLDAWLATR
jgi:putative aldouronate transport system substrate-binding protein